jgi:hypothetical protein
MGIWKFYSHFACHENGACEIDVIILESEMKQHKGNYQPFYSHVQNLQFMINTNTKDIIIGKLVGIKKKLITSSLHLIT